jgi:hypothetical protein
VVAFSFSKDLHHEITERLKIEEYESSFLFLLALGALGGFARKFL